MCGLFIAAFCVCFMLRFHNFAIRSANEIEKGPTKAVRVILTDAVMDAVKSRDTMKGAFRYLFV